jgi:hypothetical protein
MTDRELALDIARKWLEATAKLTALEAFLEQRIPEWKKQIPKETSLHGPTPQQKLAQLQHAFDADNPGVPDIRILHEVLFENQYPNQQT